MFLSDFTICIYDRNIFLMICGKFDIIPVSKISIWPFIEKIKMKIARAHYFFNIQRTGIKNFLMWPKRHSPCEIFLRSAFIVLKNPRQYEGSCTRKMRHLLGEIFLMRKFGWGWKLMYYYRAYAEWGPPRGARNHTFTQVFHTNHTKKLPEIHVHAKFIQSRWTPRWFFTQ